MKKLFLAFLATGVVQLTNFSSGIILARMLEPSARGEFAQIIAWFGFITSILLFGINDSITYYRSRNQTEGAEAMCAALLISVPLISASVLLCIGVITIVFAQMSPAVLDAAWLFLLFPPLWQWQQIFYSYFQSGSSPLVWTVVRVIPGLIYIGGLVLIIQIGLASPAHFIAANLLGMAAALGVSIAILFGSGDRLKRPSAALTRRVIWFGLPVVFQRIALACRDTLDRMVLPFFVTSAALGHYVVASSVAYLIYVAGMTVDMVGFPAMARAATDEARRAIAEFMISITFWALVLLVIPLMLIREPVVLLLFGPDYAASISLVPWFLVAGAAQALRIVVGGAFKAFNLSRSMARFEFVGAGIMAVVMIGSATSLGEFSGALAHLISALVSLAMGLYACVTVLKLSPRHLFMPRRADLVRTLHDVQRALRPAKPS